MAFSGIGAIKKALDGIEEMKPDRRLVPGTAGVRRRLRQRPESAAARRHRGQTPPRAAVGAAPPVPSAASAGDGHRRPISPSRRSPAVRYPDAQIREALRSVGKLSPDDELNCGGCGYDSCREFASALISQKAERAMCVTYMRKLALKKANALIQKMPSAVVIVNDAMRIIEFNAAFATLFAGQRRAGGDAGRRPWKASTLSEVMPFASLFHTVLKSGEDILDRDLRYQKTILHATIFTIEKHCVVGGILQDITEPAVRKAAGDPQGAGGHPEAARDHAADRLPAGRERRRIRDHAQLDHRILFAAKPDEPKDETMTGESFIDVDFCQRAKPARSSPAMFSSRAKSRRRAASSPSSPTAWAAA